MKNLLMVGLISIFSLPLSAQRTTPESYSRYDDYMRRSKRKQTAGIIFLSTGAALTAGGTVLIVDGINRNDRNNTNYSGELSSGEVEIALGVIVTAMGVASMSASIPFFVGAHRSKMKALSVSIKPETAPQLYKASFSRQVFPAISFCLPLGR